MIQGKKIFAFAGRIHHFHRLAGIGIRLRDAGAEFSFICADNAWNIDPSTEYLIPDNIPYVHLLDYLLDTKEVGRLTKEFLDNTIECNSELISKTSPFIVAYSMREAIECVVGFRNFIEVEKPALVIILHENNFWTKLLAYLCHEAGIPSIAFQEGLLRYRDQETMKKQSSAAEYVNRLFVWSHSSEQAYRDAGVPAEKIKVSGMSHMDHYFKSLKLENWPDYRLSVRRHLGFLTDRRLVTFGLPQMNQFEGNVLQTISLLGGWAVSNQIQLAVKFHPLDSYEMVENIEKGAANMPGIRILQDIDSILLTLCSDAVLTQHSSFGLEALALDIPLLEIDLENRGILQSFVEDGVATLVGIETMDNITEVISGTKKADVEIVDEWVKKNVGPRDGGAIDRIVKVIDKLI